MNKASPFDPSSVLYENFLISLPPQARLAWSVAIATGLRISDILRLQVSDLKPSMIVKEKKTGKNRKINMPMNLIGLLQNNAKMSNSKYCFPSSKNPTKPLHRDTIAAQIEKAKKACGIEGLTISMHSARKMYAIRKFHETGDHRIVQKDLGHRHEGTTLVYIYGAREAR